MTVFNGPVKFKQCLACKQHKYPGDYNKNKGSIDGLQVTCRTCSNERSRLWREDQRGALVREKAKTAKLRKEIRAANSGKVKTCRLCQETKPVTAFHSDINKADGLYTQCKECKRANQRISEKKCRREGRETRDRMNTIMSPPTLAPERVDLAAYWKNAHDQLLKTVTEK